MAVAFFGDGATNIGAFHEARQHGVRAEAADRVLCENNEYGEFTPRHKTMAITDVVDRAAGLRHARRDRRRHGRRRRVRGGREAIARARPGDGPSLIEAKTYRFYNHHGVQNLGLKYRTDDEVAEWKQRDPIFGSKRA